MCANAGAEGEPTSSVPSSMLLDGAVALKVYWPAAGFDRINHQPGFLVCPLRRINGTADVQQRPVQLAEVIGKNTKDFSQVLSY